MNRREIAAWIVGTCIVLSVFATIFVDEKTEPQPYQPPPKGVMEKKFESLKDDMTRGEVEAILGATTSFVGSGGFGTSENWGYLWIGEDGMICIYFAKNPDHEPSLGRRAMDSRVKTMFLVKRPD